MMSRNSEKLSCSNKINTVQGGSALTFALNKNIKKRKKRAATYKQGKQKDKFSSHKIIQNKCLSSSNLSLAQSAATFYNLNISNEEIVNSDKTNISARFYCYSCQFCNSIECQCSIAKSETHSNTVNNNQNNFNICLNIGANDTININDDKLSVIDSNNTDTLAQLIDVCELRKNKEETNNIQYKTCSNSKQLHRFAIYKNLCKYCGFAIGNASTHLHCVEKTLKDIEIQRSSNSDSVGDSILCVTCHSAFKGENLVF